MHPPKFLLLDLAGTLLEKQYLYEKLCAFFERKSISLSPYTVITTHRRLTEETQFPDKTNLDFYLKFNQDYLLRLGLNHSSSLAEELFIELKNLPWQPKEGVLKFLQTNQLPKGIISNWDRTLEAKVESFFPSIKFDFILGSESEGIAKPSLDFYKRALALIPFPASEVLYIGDSIRLDMEPAQSLGIHTILLDPEGTFKEYSKTSIQSFDDLAQMFVS